MAGLGAQSYASISSRCWRMLAFFSAFLPSFGPKREAWALKPSASVRVRVRSGCIAFVRSAVFPWLVQVVLHRRWGQVVQGRSHALPNCT